MERCPTCNARYSGKPICHRCKTDLSPLTDIENMAKEHLEKAIRAFHFEDFEQMFFHARRSCSLRRTLSSEKLLWCAALLTRQYDLAMSQLPERDTETGVLSD